MFTSIFIPRSHSASSHFMPVHDSFNYFPPHFSSFLELSAKAYSRWSPHPRSANMSSFSSNESRKLVVASIVLALMCGSVAGSRSVSGETLRQTSQNIKFFIVSQFFINMLQLFFLSSLKNFMKCSLTICLEVLMVNWELVNDWFVTGSHFA